MNFNFFLSPHQIIVSLANLEIQKATYNFKHATIWTSFWNTVVFDKIVSLWISGDMYVWRGQLNLNGYEKVEVSMQASKKKKEEKVWRKKIRKTFWTRLNETIKFEGTHPSLVYDCLLPSKFCKLKPGKTSCKTKESATFRSH